MELVLFFTRGISLENWVERGLFEREKLIYEEHLNNKTLDKVFWVTYGQNDHMLAAELIRNGRLHPKISVLPMPKSFKGYYGQLAYSLASPLVHSRALSSADIFKTNQMDGAWTAVIAKRIFGKPLIVRTGYTWSTTVTPGYSNKIKIRLRIETERLAYTVCDKAIVTSNAGMEHIMEKYGVSRNKIEVQPNYVDTDLFKPGSGRKYAYRIVFVGRFSPEKNLINLVQAANDTGFDIDLYGQGPMQAELQTLAEGLKIKVRFHAPVPNHEIPGILKRYRFFALPSLFEGMPKSLAEAMSCGLTCLGTDVSGIRDLIEHEKTGLLAPTTDRAGLRTLLNQAKALKKEEQKALGRNAREYAVKHFSLPVYAAREAELFKGLLSEKA